MKNVLYERGETTCLGCETSYKNGGEMSHMEGRNVLIQRGGEKSSLDYAGYGARRLSWVRNLLQGGETS